MKRSELNGWIDEALAFFDSFHFLVPAWARWSPGQWNRAGGVPDEIRDCQLGWDITTFGSGDFKKMGLILLTTRNGLLVSAPGKNYPKPYAEKIMMVRDGQVTPRHFHMQKQEDIINRGGGNLVIELWPADPAKKRLLDMEFTVPVDAFPRKLQPGGKVVLSPGESVCLSPCHAHLFYGDGDVMVGEVSRVNDDFTDNCFVDGMPRFDQIEEDEPARYLLGIDYRPKIK
ncbi:D-lyxose/D-mannose family sugar isomerase [uncultured Victivallis sp.]|nr:D-lyxose/D-mannose family sugar isomerase [uncultured Victivallis sp.]